VEVEVSADLINRAMSETVQSTIRMMQGALGDTPPDLSQDVSARGISMVGGHAWLSDFAEVLSVATGVEATVAAQADAVVIRGLQMCLDEMSALHGLLKRNVS
jgi:actin-like ATPase involved in cell morphogenesis